MITGGSCYHARICDVLHLDRRQVSGLPLHTLASVVGAKASIFSETLLLIACSVAQVIVPKP